MTSGPNCIPIPRFEGDLPGDGTGSDHSNSHISPEIYKKLTLVQETQKQKYL